MSSAWLEPGEQDATYGNERDQEGIESMTRKVALLTFLFAAATANGLLFVAIERFEPLGVAMLLMVGSSLIGAVADRKRMVEDNRAWLALVDTIGWKKYVEWSDFDACPLDALPADGKKAASQYLDYVEGTLEE